jgi:hypothetical protein
MTLALLVIIVGVPVEVSNFTVAAVLPWEKNAPLPR